MGVDESDRPLLSLDIFLKFLLPASLVIWILYWYLFLKERQSLNAVEDQVPASNAGLSPDMIHLLPRHDRWQGPEEDCAVCLGEKNGSGTTVLTPCMHQLHAVCADEWLVRSATCPVCRSTVVPGPAERV